MEDIIKLQHISLASKVSQELKNNIKIDDRDLAEFVIHLAGESKNTFQFKAQLESNDANFPEYLVQRLYELIDKMMPSTIKEQLASMSEVQQAPKVEHKSDAKEDLVKRFPGLAIANKKTEVEEPKKQDEEIDIDVDDVDIEPEEAGDSEEDENDKSKDKKEEKMEISEKKTRSDKPRSRSHSKGRNENRDRKRRSDKRASHSRSRSNSRSRRRKHHRDSRSNSLDDRRRRRRSSSKDRRRRNSRRSRSRSDERRDRRDRSRRSRSESLENRIRKRSDRSRDDRDRRDRRDRDRDDYGSSRYDNRDRRDRRDGERKDQRDIVVGEIYDGIVTKVLDFGGFIALKGCKERKEGLCHVSQISPTRRVAHPEEEIKRNMKVKVKILNMYGTKLSLSMKEVDQETGRDLNPATSKPEVSDLSSTVPKDFDKFGTSLAEFKRLAGERFGSLTGIKIDDVDDENARRPKKKLGSPSLWERSRLHAAGFTQLDEDEEIEEVDNEEDREIELNDKEPMFLKGQTTRGGITLSPIRIVKAPEGSLQRAILNQKERARERIEEENQAQKAVADQLPANFNQAWEDANPMPGERTLVSSIQNVKTDAAAPTFQSDMPEWKKISSIQGVSLGRRVDKSIREQREGLPIFHFRQELLEGIASVQILVVVGETGCGKTTQMTQYLAEAGYCKDGKRIGCTQPRRVAAISVAKRVAEECGVRLGEEVGYSIRFEDMTSPKTAIKYMTDGMLLREALLDPKLNSYSALILDEAHERTIHTDVLFGLLKETLKERPDLKLIVTSATLAAKKFSAYFNNCNLFTIPGRTYPVEKFYSKEPETDYVEAALITVLQIHLSEPPGDILVFLTGQEEIDNACQILYERMKALQGQAPELIILPVYSALPSEMQTRIFEPAPEGSRKCVIATNIAEASLTIDGILYVVDPGFAKLKAYNPKTGVDSLVVTPISQASANQRAGRAGRTAPGKCFRLYTEEAFQNEMMENAIPEIQRSNMANTVQTLKAMGINDLLNFDFMDPPPVQTLIAAMEMLYALGSLDEEGLLTKLGRRMAEFPLEPQMAKMLLTSVDLGCSDEIITIIAMLSVQNVFHRPKEKKDLADQKRMKFHQPEGDHLTLLAVYEAWKLNKQSSAWCHENFIQQRSMKRSQDVRKQLLEIMHRNKLDVRSCGKNYSKIRKTIAAGYFMHAARKDPQEGYVTVIDNQHVYIHPSSSLFNKSVDWILYHELVFTSKEYMREVCLIDSKWLLEVAPQFFKESDSNHLSKRKRAQKIEPLHNKYEDPNAWRLSRRRKY